MPDSFKDFYREPSKTHQCMHYSEDDGTRCRAHAMLNQYMCYVHRTEDVPTVIENDPFLIEHLADRDSIQHALGDIAARLASNRIDLKRAGLLVYTIQSAVLNLSARNPPPPQPSPDTPSQPTEPPAL